MVEKLLIYTDDEELGVISFPKDGTQAALSSYTSVSYTHLTLPTTPYV